MLREQIKVKDLGKE